MLEITTNFEVLGFDLCLSGLCFMQRAYYTTPDVASESYYRGVAFPMPYVKETTIEYSVKSRLTERLAMNAES